MIKIFFTVILFYTCILFSQNFQNEFISLRKKARSTEQNYLSKFDIHIAAGIAQGARIGFRYLFYSNYSFELAYGQNILNFITLADYQRRYSLGINYHLNGSNAVFNFSTTFVEQPGSVYEAVLFSPTFGFFPISKHGFNTFFRFGFYLRVIKNFPANKWKSEDIGPNLDLGISWTF